MNTADLYKLLKTKTEEFQESFNSLEEGALNEELLVQLQQSWNEVNDTLVVLKFMLGVPDQATFEVERESHEESEIPEEEKESVTSVMHEIDEFENAIAEDAEVETPEMMVSNSPENETEEDYEVHSGILDDEDLSEDDAEISHEIEESLEQGEPLETISEGEKAGDQARFVAHEEVETNEKLASDEASLADRLKKSPVTDLKAAIGLNQRFLFSNELFNGNMEAFNRALNELNHLESLDDANRYMEIQLEPTFEWNTESETVLEFKELVERRFM